MPLRKGVAGELHRKKSESVLNYDPRLSGLRGLAALMVVLLHVWDYGAVSPSSSVASFYLTVVAGFWIGVPVFLMLSIFLLLRSLDGNPDIKHYFLRRVRRIWPIYFGSVVLIFVVFQGMYRLSISDYVGFFTFTEYYTHPSMTGPLGVFWTLQLEEAAYVLIPLLHRTRHKGWVAGCLISISTAWVALLYNTNVLVKATGWSLAYLWFSPPTWLAAYGLGILVYLGWFRGAGWKRVRLLAPLSLVLAGFGVPFVSYTIVEYDVFLPLGLLGFAAVLADPPRFLRLGALLGEGSYAMYASHVMFLLAFGIVGLPLTVLISLGVEFVLRPYELSRRLHLPFFSGGRSAPAKGLPKRWEAASHEAGPLPEASGAHRVEKA